MPALARAVIGLCVHNSEPGLPAVFQNIRAITHLFKALKVIIAYDNSEDRSWDLVKEFQAECGPQNVEIHTDTNRGALIRTHRISNSRNEILKRIRFVYPDYEYFMMMDCNEYSCVGPIRPGILAGILARDDWDAVSFDREAGYYDYWALSYDPFIYSIYHFNSNKNVHAIMREDFERRLAEARAADPEALIPVFSAFNGFAIYRTPVFIDCSYSWQIDMKYFPMDIVFKQTFLLDANIRDLLLDDCEHRKFHMEAIHEKGARVRVSVQSLFGLAGPPAAGLKRRGPA